jgi:Galactosyltransferase
VNSRGVQDEINDEIDIDPEADRAIQSVEFERTFYYMSYRYRVNNPHLCQLDSSHENVESSNIRRLRIFLFVYIHSAPENYMKRLLLRQTWVRPTLYNLPVRFAFFVGIRSNDPAVNQAVQLESDHFHDVIQAEFEDSYKNLSMKSLSAIHWISMHCNSTRFVLKTDDDAYVNMRALLRHLSDIDHPSGTAGGPQPRHMILCRIWKTMEVLRNDTKWGVSRDEFPADFYPAYCSGIAWVMTLDMIVAMDRIASKVKLFWIDDVYITGLLPGRYNI